MAWIEDSVQKRSIGPFRLEELKALDASGRQGETREFTREGAEREVTRKWIARADWFSAGGARSA